jgi:hypothetical protein
LEILESHIGSIQEGEKGVRKLRNSQTTEPLSISIINNSTMYYSINTWGCGWGMYRVYTKASKVIYHNPIFPPISPSVAQALLLRMGIPFIKILYVPSVKLKIINGNL